MSYPLHFLHPCCIPTNGPVTYTRQSCCLKLSFLFRYVQPFQTGAETRPNLLILKELGRTVHYNLFNKICNPQKHCIDLQKQNPRKRNGREEGCGHRLNMELDLQSLFGLHVHSCTHWLRPHSNTRAVVSQDRRHLLCDTWMWRSVNLADKKH